VPRLSERYIHVYTSPSRCGLNAKINLFSRAAYAVWQFLKGLRISSRNGNWTTFAATKRIFWAPRPMAHDPSSPPKNGTRISYQKLGSKFCTPDAQKLHGTRMHVTRAKFLVRDSGTSSLAENLGRVPWALERLKCICGRAQPRSSLGKLIALPQPPKTALNREFKFSRTCVNYGINPCN